MDELVQVVSSKTGLSADQARAAATATLDFVKGKLPGPVAGQIDGLLGGGAGSSTDAAGGVMDQAKDMMGGMFGGKEENPS
jgi:hypothetical protein